MNDLHKLKSSVHRLTREHRSTHIDPLTQKTSYPTEMSLFEQLRIEQAAGRRGGQKAGSGSRSPIALAAMVLWSDIQETLNNTHITLTGTDGAHLPAEQKLTQWIDAVNQTGDELQLGRCIRVTEAWANSITSLLNPEPSIAITGACPACGQTHAWAWEDGEYLRNTALTATIHTANCQACEATWPRQEFENLAAAITTEAPIRQENVA